MKKCFKCDNFLDLNGFYRHPKMKGGHLNKCKSCCRKASSENRNNNIEYYRAYDRKRGSRQTSSYVRQWRRENPLKYKAHCIVNNHVRAGDLIKQPCEVCGKSKSVAHHDDYRYPLVVRWMCQAHHKQWHVNNEPKNG